MTNRELAYRQYLRQRQLYHLAIAAGAYLDNNHQLNPEELLSYKPWTCVIDDLERSFNYNPLSGNWESDIDLHVEFNNTWKLCQDSGDDPLTFASTETDPQALLFTIYVGEDPYVFSRESVN